jgi:hypothetical protein
MAVIACAGCSGSAASEAPDENAGVTSSPIVGGTASTASQDEVVLIIRHSASSEIDPSCSGTLLAPNLVLTARHCVAAADATSQCDSSGRSVTGGHVYDDYDPNDLYVFAGPERPVGTSLASVTQRGSAIIDDGSSVLCNHDLALLLLATPVPGAKIAPVRLDAPTAAEEHVTLVGWGVTDETEKIPTRRQQRTNDDVLAVGPSHGLGPAELIVGEGPCGGDSGGPALAESGAVIGTLSRGGNGTDDAGVKGCVGATSIYTQASAFRDLILSAYDRAGATPWLEGQPSPEGAPPAADVPPERTGGCAAAPLDRHGIGTGAITAVGVVVVALARRRSRRS